MSQDKNKPPVQQEAPASESKEAAVGAGGKHHTSELQRHKEVAQSRSQVTENKDNNNVIQALTQRLGKVNRLLTWKERQKLSYTFEDIRFPYYRMWRTDANRYFRLAVILKDRRTRLLAKGHKP